MSPIYYIRIYHSPKAKVIFSRFKGTTSKKLFDFKVMDQILKIFRSRIMKGYRNMSFVECLIVNLLNIG